MAVHSKPAPNLPIDLTVPGKLVLAGEYAVLAPGEPGLVAAVAPGLQAHWETGFEVLVAAPDLGVGPIGLAEAAEALPFVAKVAAVIKEALGQPVPRGTLTLRGQQRLDGQKVGLGSSASACVAAARVWLQAMGHPVTDEAVFRIAGVAHARQQRNGSGIDVAAISFGGLGCYRSLGMEFFLQLKGEALLTTPLPAGYWRPLALPKGTVLRAGFTGQSAATAPAVAQVLAWAEAQPQQWLSFASASRRAVELCVRGMAPGQLASLHMGMREARRALRDLGQAVGLLIETPSLCALADAAEALGASGKTSGAGGGDCGIAVIEAGEQEKRLLNRWQSLGITDVPITVAPSILAR
jgi:phosphomevalonate kinase